MLHCSICNLLNRVNVFITTYNYTQSCLNLLFNQLFFLLLILKKTDSSNTYLFQSCLLIKYAFSSTNRMNATLTYWIHYAILWSVHVKHFQISNVTYLLKTTNFIVMWSICILIFIDFIFCCIFWFNLIFKNGIKFFIQKDQM